MYSLPKYNSNWFFFFHRLFKYNTCTSDCTLYREGLYKYIIAGKKTKSFARKKKTFCGIRTHSTQRVYAFYDPI